MVLSRVNEALSIFISSASTHDSKSIGKIIPIDALLQEEERGGFTPGLSTAALSNTTNLNIHRGRSKGHCKKHSLPVYFAVFFFVFVLVCFVIGF